MVDKDDARIPLYAPLCFNVSKMESGNTHFRSYVFTGFKLGKSAIQLTEELQKVFGANSAPCLRTVQLLISSIKLKEGSFSVRKNVSPGRPRSARVTEMVNKVENLIAKQVLATPKTCIHP